MVILLLALVAGLVSALAFEPVGFWVLMPVAFAALMELLDRTNVAVAGSC